MLSQLFTADRVAARGAISPGRNRELDWLRAYAIIVVVLEHAIMVKPVPTFWSHIVRHWYEGQTGVDLFFVISGLVISQSLVDRLDTQRAQGRAAMAIAMFYLKRLVRLWPPAAFWALAILAGSIVTRATPSFPPPAICLEKLVAAVTYTSNWSEIADPTRIGYFYSLATEMQFYLLFPLAICLVAPRWRLAAAGAVFVAGLIPGFETHPQTRFAGIVVGVMLFLLSRTRLAARLEPVGLASPMRSGAFTIALVALLVTCTLPPMSCAAASHIAALVASVLVGAAIYQRGYVSALGVPRVLDWIGSRSYSIYLCHIPVMLLNRALDFHFEVRGNAQVAAQLIPDAAIVVQWLVSVVLVSELTYRLLERPCQTWARDVSDVIERELSSRPLGCLAGRPVATPGVGLEPSGGVV